MFGQKENIPKILKKFYKQKLIGKPLYVEAYKIMAATSDIIKMKFGNQDAKNVEMSATAFFACL
jgi:hypothetical protein